MYMYSLPRSYITYAYLVYIPGMLGHPHQIFEVMTGIWTSTFSPTLLYPTLPLLIYLFGWTGQRGRSKQQTALATTYGETSSFYVKGDLIYNTDAVFGLCPPTWLHLFEVGCRLFTPHQLCHPTTRTMSLFSRKIAYKVSYSRIREAHSKPDFIRDCIG